MFPARTLLLSRLANVVLKVPERLSARDSVYPRPKQLRCMQGLEFAAHDYENILQHIIGI
jgi:hypothetical protein